MPSDITPPYAGDAYLHTAVRAFATSATETDDGDAPPKRKPGTADSRWPEYVLIFDTETTTDEAQRLNFGCYRFCRWTDDGRLLCVEEGLFHGDDLPRRFADGYATLQAYVRDQWGNVAPAYSANMPLYSRRAFVDEVFWKAAGETGSQALVAGFNLPFDLSRLAIRWGEARDYRTKPDGEGAADTGRHRTREKRRNRFAGGFSFAVWDYRGTRDKEADPRRERSRYRPRVCVKHIDNKRALTGFGGMKNDAEGAQSEGTDTRSSFPGYFVDLRTLVFALTDRGHSLDSACEAFGIAPDKGKMKAKEHGIITPGYIDYCRQDVLATQHLLEKVREEYDRHPIDLQPTRAYSPASVAKAYLRAMGIVPPLARQPDFPRDVLGHAMAAYYGGRAECRIRHVPVPVVYCDFLSMYPTVNVNMGLWRFITAERIEAV
ncbi:MAG: DNA polymerase, partial [Chloroflexota bacterium]|nr:DNA polymerase [Chloroflexota bacterium]